MTYVAAGYGITLVTIAAYALRLLRRGRDLERALDAGGVESGTGAAGAEA